MPLKSDTSKIQAKLRTALQADPSSGRLERLAAASIGRLLGVDVAIAKSGFQHGADAGIAGRQGRRLRIECKKYGDSTSLSRRELLGEVDHALAGDHALEAWILVATRDVSLDIERELVKKGEECGIPVVILDFKSTGYSSLAALCAFAPDLVESIFSSAAGALARALQPSSGDAIERLRRDLASWSIGFESVRTRSLERLQSVWQSPRTSNAVLGQNAAGGSVSQRIRRQRVHQALDDWWSNAGSDAPMAVVGLDGVGKTWATLDWLVERRDSLPITLVVPSSAFPALAGSTDMALMRFLGDRLYELSGVRDTEHWLRRLEHLLKRPVVEGPVLTLLLDGVNQEPSVDWLQILKVLQGDAFAGRVRIIVSSRTHYYESRLRSCRGLVVPAVRLAVEPYDATPGGELDQMLAFENLTRDNLPPDVVDIARTPRLFRLVLKFGVQLAGTGQVTVHRLLWEYGRDSLGDCAGRSFNEAEWRAWLQEIASRHLAGVREYSLKSLAETASRADLSPHEVAARLSDIVDGQFTEPTTSGGLQLRPTIVVHALGVALLAVLDTVPSPTFESLEAAATRWLDPIAGIDERSDVLRAAVSIWFERGGTPPAFGGVLVTLWLQTQNITDGHRRAARGSGTSVSKCTP